MAATTHVFAFLPYLRTVHPVVFRDVTFRNSDDTTGMPDEAQAHFAILKSLFFLRDNYRLQHTTYVLGTLTGTEQDEVLFETLLEFQTILGYLYSAPRPQFNDIFLSSDHASLYWFIPKEISEYLIHQDREVEQLPGSDYPPPNNRHELPAYEVYLNGKLVTWVTQGSRIYPCTPRITVNMSQDIFHDLQQAGAGLKHGALLDHFRRQGRKRTPHDKQFLTALKWYNRAQVEPYNEQLGILFLAVAFESLLNLPGEERITQRFTEAVTLLLGRIPRLESWAQQFYNARSDIAHKGSTHRLHFFAADDYKKASADTRYKPLTATARHIFQLCAATIITGAELAESASLISQLATNAERFERICKTLNQPGTPAELITATADDIADINEYRYQSEGGLTYKQVIGAARLMISKYLATNPQESAERINAMQDLTTATDEFDQLEAISKVSTGFGLPVGDTRTDVRAIMQFLINCVWHYTFMYHHALQQKKKGQP